MTPLETVSSHYRFPERINPHPLQVRVINTLSPLTNSGEWLDMGCGKTFCATACGLFHKVSFGNQIVVIMPPILLRQWGRWLAEIKPALTVTEYRGTPSQRAAMSLDADFVLVGIQIFKKEYDRFAGHFEGKPCTVIVDEANMLGNIKSDMHRKVYDFCVGRQKILLTGTPMNNVMETYSLLKFTAPGTYRNVTHFANTHVEEYDFYDKPIKFRQLGVLADNMTKNSERILFEDMYPDTLEPMFDLIHYDLDPDHYKLYKKLAEEQILLLPEGGKIDATSANNLMHALGQIICNRSHFSGDEGDKSSAIEMIEQKLEELGDGKLVVFAHYKMTVANLKKSLAKYGAVTINSEVSEADKDRNLTRFMSDPACRVIVIQFISGGKGLDGLQHVCNHAFFAEPCQQPRDFHQCVGRLKRMGQTKRVMVMLGIANKTTQIRGFNNLLMNDTLVNKVIRNSVDLRDAIYGVNQ